MKGVFKKRTPRYKENVTTTTPKFQHFFKLKGRFDELEKERIKISTKT